MGDNMYLKVELAEDPSYATGAPYLNKLVQGHRTENGRRQASKQKAEVERGGRNGGEAISVTADRFAARINPRQCGGPLSLSPPSFVAHSVEQDVWSLLPYPSCQEWDASFPSVPQCTFGLGPARISFSPPRHQAAVIFERFYQAVTAPTFVLARGSSLTSQPAAPTWQLRQPMRLRWHFSTWLASIMTLRTNFCRKRASTEGPPLSPAAVIASWPGVFPRA